MDSGQIWTILRKSGSLKTLSAVIKARILTKPQLMACKVKRYSILAAAVGFYLSLWRGAALTLWSTFFGVAFALFAWAGLPLVDSHGPGALFALHGAWMAAMALWLSVLLPTARLVRVTDPLTWRAVLARHAAIYRSPALSAPALGWLCYTLTFVSLLTLLPGVMEPSSPGWLLGALPLTSIAVALTLGVALLRKLSAVQVILLGFAASAIAVAALLALPGPLWPVFALFAALALVQSASFAAVPELASDPADRALANGALAQMGNVGNLLGMPLLLAILGLGGATAGLLAVMTAYIRVLGVSLGLPADFRGPLAKQQRMAVLTGACVLSAFDPLWHQPGLILWISLIIIAVGSGLTVVRRLVGAYLRLQRRGIE